MEGNGQAIFGQTVGLEARKLVKREEGKVGKSWQVEARSVDIFKAEVGKFLMRTGVKGYGEKAGKWD